MSRIMNAAQWAFPSNIFHEFSALEKPTTFTYAIKVSSTHIVALRPIMMHWEHKMELTESIL